MRDERVWVTCAWVAGLKSGGGGEIFSVAVGMLGATGPYGLDLRRCSEEAWAGV